jgi:hypothetical protein
MTPAIGVSHLWLLPQPCRMQNDAARAAAAPPRRAARDSVGMWKALCEIRPGVEGIVASRRVPALLSPPALDAFGKLAPLLRHFEQMHSFFRIADELGDASAFERVFPVFFSPRHPMSPKFKGVNGQHHDWFRTNRDAAAGGTLFMNGTFSLRERRTTPWGVMRTREDYRRYAEECERLAKQLPDHAEALLAMARTWRQLERDSEEEATK